MKDRQFWAIVLAGGEGQRLADTARQAYGSRLPKQFLSFGQERTLLQATLDRLQPVIVPQRTVVVVARRHLELAGEQLSAFPGVEFVAQPANVGTGPGVLLPLVQVLKRDPGADVALVPSDHDFRAPALMREALLRARRAAAAAGSSMVLLGATAESAASDLGWIVTETARARQGVRAIREFVEKPAPCVANRLFAQGALWNTMLSVTRAQVLWELARKHLPAQLALFESYAQDKRAGSGAGARLEQLYQRLSPADFSRDWVAACTGLRATAMPGAGWSDCGTPERLAAVLRQTPSLAKATTSLVLRNAPNESRAAGVQR
jgi:mannose-1-phosphate guanylyltransferase